MEQATNDANLKDFCVYLDRETGSYGIAEGKRTAEAALSIIFKYREDLRGLKVEAILDDIATVENDFYNTNKFRQAAYRLLKICEPIQADEKLLEMTDRETEKLRQILYVVTGIDTLYSRGDRSLDVHELDITTIEKMLRAAYLNGRNTGRTGN